MTSDPTGLQPRAGSAGKTPVDEFRSKISTNFFRGQQWLDDYVNRVTLRNEKIWTTSFQNQTLAHGWWLTEVLWQVTMAYFEGVLQPRKNKDKLPPPLYEACKFIGDFASQWTLYTVHITKADEVGVSVSPAALVDWPQLSYDRETVPAAWAATRSMMYQVQTDLERLQQSGVPRRLQPVFSRLIAELQPNVAVLDQLHSEWLDTSSSHDRLRLMERALPAVQAVFRSGQCIWAPYLLGSDYVELLNRPLSYDDLELTFDPWILTDPAVKAAQLDDPQTLAQLHDFWVANPAPMLAPKFMVELAAARERRQIRYVDGGALPLCPWPACWLAVRNVTLGGVNLLPGDLLVVYTGTGAHGTFVTEVRKVGRLRFDYEIALQPVR